MADRVFGAFVDIESGPVPIPDSPQLRKPADVAFPSSTPLELDDLTWSAKHNGSMTGNQTSTPATTPPNCGSQTPQMPVDSFSSRPASPRRHEAANLVQSWSSPSMSKWRILSCCLMYFGNGMNDSAPGALIPYIETHYKIGYAVVSLVFVSQAAGFITAAFFTEALKGRIGQAKTLVFSELLMVISFVGLVCTPPFPVVVCLFFFLGLALAINLALNNVFCANLDKSTVILGAAQGAYGVGGVVGPIIATTLVSSGVIWSRYYAIPLGVCLLGATSAGWTFRGYEQERAALQLPSVERIAGELVASEPSRPSKRKLLVQALKFRVTLIGALFTFAYQGAEVAISGWIISFLITVRHGDPAHVGYVTAGFWVSNRHPSNG
jgi:fucose permease